MNSNNINIVKYKHDTIGKFNTITSMIAPLDEKSFDDSQSSELFHAVHEVICKMVRTSRQTIFSKFKNEILLIIQDECNDVDLPKILIADISVRYLSSEKSITYFLSLAENTENICFLLGKLFSILPIKKVESRSINPEIAFNLKSLGII